MKEEEKHADNSAEKVRAATIKANRLQEVRQEAFEERTRKRWNAAAVCCVE